MMDISTLSTAELKQMLTQIPQEIVRREKSEKAALLKELEAKAVAAGYSLEDLVGQGGKKERSAVAIKYRHPQQAELTWTGRGRQPRWVVEFLGQGGALEQLQA
jgi:DNA-binding protein H-NS